MAFIKLTIVAGVALLLSACVSAEHRPEMRPIHVANARTPVTAALNSPMKELTGKAEKNAYGQFELGLAMLAGRSHPDIAKQPDLTARALILNDRLLPQIEAYKNQSTVQQMIFADWSKIIAVTPEDEELIEIWLKLNSPDYWLSRARDASTSQTLYIYQPPVCTKCTSSMMPIETTNPVIDPSLIATAEHCVYAVRKRLGPVTASYEGIPLSFRLMHLSTLRNETARVEAELDDPDPTRSWEIGEAACGTQEQFNQYFVNLQTSVAQQ